MRPHLIMFEETDTPIGNAANTEPTDCILIAALQHAASVLPSNDSRDRYFATKIREAVLDRLGIAGDKVDEQD